MSEDGRTSINIDDLIELLMKEERERITTADQAWEYYGKGKGAVIRQLALKWQMTCKEPRLKTFFGRVYRDDFLAWCEATGYPPPTFWKREQKPEQIPLEERLICVVKRAFWEKPPPDGCNRPTKQQIVDWLTEGYQLTPKAAERVYKASKPGHIPPGGNLPQKNRPYPSPPYPTE